MARRYRAERGMVYSLTPGLLGSPDWPSHVEADTAAKLLKVWEDMSVSEPFTRHRAHWTDCADQLRQAIADAKAQQEAMESVE